MQFSIPQINNSTNANSESARPVLLWVNCEQDALNPRIHFKLNVAIIFRMELVHSPTHHNNWPIEMKLNENERKENILSIYLNLPSH